MATSNFNQMCMMVSKFNYLFGVINYNYNPVDANAFTNLFIPESTQFDPKQISLRWSLINEEIKELVDACHTTDVIEIVDALCDILYVVAGAKVYFNLPNNDINDMLDFASIHNTNYNEKINIGKIILLLIEKEGLVDDIIKKLLELSSSLEQLTNDILNGSLSQASDSAGNCSQAPDSPRVEKNIITYNKLLDAITYNVFLFAENIEININKLFAIVHESNMSKICNNVDDAIETVSWYKINELRYNSPSYNEVEIDDQKYYVISDKETQKILKSIKYNKVKFETN
jgi:predicted HAD superfamily Cof-like phosphohydrolase